jgi:phosphatidylglycerophosphate synthase
MLDGRMRHVIDPFVNRIGRWLAGAGVGANAVTLIGLGFGLLSAVLIAFGLSGWLVVVPLLIGRLADGLDGAVARASSKTDFGGYLDLTSDFLFYGAIPFAFVARDVGANGLAGGFLLLSFYVNGATFLGYAVLAEKAGMETRDRGEKSLYFTAGLLEGTETILFFVLVVFVPDWFAPLAWVFGALCFVTAVSRVALAWRVFRP